MSVYEFMRRGGLVLLICFLVWFFLILVGMEVFGKIPRGFVLPFTVRENIRYADDDGR